jgi:hypothetical protein
MRGSPKNDTWSSRVNWNRLMRVAPTMAPSCKTIGSREPRPASRWNWTLLIPTRAGTWNSPVFVKSENQEIEHSKSWFAESFEPARMKTRRGKSIVELHASGWNLASLHGLYKIGSRSEKKSRPRLSKEGCKQLILMDPKDGEKP